jgi:hypothetical protein
MFLHIFYCKKCKIPIGHFTVKSRTLEGEHTESGAQRRPERPAARANIILIGTRLLFACVNTLYSMY